jgi:hypothetical protein
LAIKLLIGQASALPLEQALQRFQSLTPASRDFYTFVYCAAWQMLSPAAQETLLSLPHLAPSGARWEEVAAVCGLPAEALNAALCQLVQLSLVQVTGDGAKAYSLHPLTRQFILSDLIGQWEAKNQGQ